MGFITPLFLFFFITAFAAYYLTGRRKRYMVLSAASCFFYACAQKTLVIVLLAAVLVTFAGGLLIEKSKEHKKAAYAAGFGAAIGLLIFFKTGALITESSASFRIILPVGMSFYIFQSCSYLTEVYKGKVRAEKNPIRYAAFVMYFPTVLSGPIQKAGDLLCQLRDDSDKPFDSELAIHGLLLFVWGMFVKLLIANRLAPAVSYIFDAPGFYTGIYHLFAAMLFSLQLYADFASYSDMAIGLSEMLGIRMAPNFRNPFLSENLAELWNRWHISLNSWFIENIYIPLGGSRKGTVRKYLNKMAVFVVSGFWHGQGLHFVFWGAYNGILMIAGELTGPIRTAFWSRIHVNENGRILTNIRRLVVFLMFSMTLIFFRAKSISDGWFMTRSIFTSSLDGLSSFYPQQLFGKSTPEMLFSMLMLLLFLLGQYMRSRGRVYSSFEKAAAPVKVIVPALILTISIFAALSGSAVTNTQFIYYQF